MKYGINQSVSPPGKTQKKGAFAFLAVKESQKLF